ncbi:transposase [Sinorhizobium meliloti]|uniref:transposase n=1 Tax=Rhizobium meliloti TaxID=382 RepID=UPI002278F943|nr:transposase [Sinorhizobium meliloti]
MRFGRRSEKLGSPTTDDEQQAFVFEDRDRHRRDPGTGQQGRERPDGKRPPRPRKGFASHLERVEVVIEPEELPEHAGKQKVRGGVQLAPQTACVQIASPPLSPSAGLRGEAPRQPLCQFAGRRSQDID